MSNSKALSVAATTIVVAIFVFAGLNYNSNKISPKDNNIKNTHVVTDTNRNISVDSSYYHIKYESLDYDPCQDNRLTDSLFRIE